MAEHVAGAPTVPQAHPHIGTVLPSGKVVVCRVAVRPTVWANDMPVPSKKKVTASAAFFKIALQ
jgi:hypothetical protein